ncbi:MAG: SBBP repeat-containing protein [Terriglobia bacterium]
MIKTDGGEIRFHKPVVYQKESDVLQQTTDNGQRTAVEGHYVLTAANQIHFALGAYNHAQALVIDPVLVYSTYLGGSGWDTANAITVDSAGNAYVTGKTSSTDFPVTPGAFQTTNLGGSSFVTKLNPTGTALVYSTYLGGSGSIGGGDIGNAIVVDTAGNVYVAGQTYSTDFPVTPGAFQTTNRAAANDDANAFVAKLNPSGTALVYSTYLGGSGLSAFTPSSGDKGNAIAVDATGDAYVAGETYSTDFR